jgi:hypothetical protein
MHPEAMKHKASLWDGEVGTSGHITDVHWEGDITQEELIDVADQITSDWQTMDLELDGYSTHDIERCALLVRPGALHR